MISHNLKPLSAGFTIIELIVVVALIGVMASLAAPSFGVMVTTSKIKGAASNLHMALLQARSQAAKGNASVSVSRSGGTWASGWVVTWDDPNDSPDAGTITLISQAAPDGTDITVEDLATTSAVNPASIVYLRSGRVQGNPWLEFTVNALTPFSSVSVKKDRCRTLRLEPSGMPSVKKADCP